MWTTNGRWTTIDQWTTIYWTTKTTMGAAALGAVIWTTKLVLKYYRKAL